jgi:hypothetical protein
LSWVPRIGAEVWGFLTWSWSRDVVDLKLELGFIYVEFAAAAAVVFK